MAPNGKPAPPTPGEIEQAMSDIEQFVKPLRKALEVKEALALALAATSQIADAQRKKEELDAEIKAVQAKRDEVVKDAEKQMADALAKHSQALAQIEKEHKAAVEANRAELDKQASALRDAGRTHTQRQAQIKKEREETQEELDALKKEYAEKKAAYDAFMKKIGAGA
jgi:chromosome segregation ATPase